MRAIRQSERSAGFEVNLMRQFLACSFLAIAALFAPILAAAQDLPQVQFGGGYAHIGNPDAMALRPSGMPGSGPAWFGEVIGNVNQRVGFLGHVTGGSYKGVGPKGQPGRA